ncbi:MAG: DUF4080 domain-containing protein [Anaeroplasmataceae bacterium]
MPNKTKIMKTLLLGINAKYIHPNLAIRLLKANTRYETDIKEFTIKEDINNIINYIIDNHYEILGISCYIWNIEIVKNIIKLLKEKNPNLIIVLGGPEVSYNGNEYLNLVDYVIKNEGERAWDMLLDYIHGNGNICEIPNLYYKDGFTYDEIVDITTIKTAYHLIEDVKNQIIYFETSRGCPFHCAYCMASLDNHVRFFDIDQIKKDLDLLLARGARVIKFLDRTFNANKKKFIDLILFLIEKHKPYNSFQFEITGDLLDEDIIDFINQKAPKNLFRFEIGIQSTNIESNRLVYRIQNNQKLFHNIRLIQNANVIDLHLDLIAGLPKEDYKSFQNTFNEVLSLRPKELQLGFLKLLHGTKLENEAYKYNYIFNKTAPYEIKCNDSLSEEDIRMIHICEDAFEKYYNYGYMKNAINYILDNINDAFHFFFNLGIFYMNNEHDGLHGLFNTIDLFIKNNYSFYDEAHVLLIEDYLKYNNVKAKTWWDRPNNKNELIRYIDSINLTPFSIDILYKYSMVVEYKDYIIVALYIDNQSYVYKHKRNS